MQIEGRIIKGKGSVYIVKAEDKYYTCAARGIFRKNKITPLPGDVVDITPIACNTDEYSASLDNIHERKNSLIRPPIANLDKLFIVVSPNPPPNYERIDKQTVIAADQNIGCAVIINKTDIDDGTAQKTYDIYTKCGVEVFTVSALTGEGIANLINTIGDDKIYAFCGSSGVGKSSLMRAFNPQYDVEIGELSAKIERGKNTTRHVELFSFGNSYIADTPGFDFLDLNFFDSIDKENLIFNFIEFEPYIGKCRFSKCTHRINSDGCAIRAAVEVGDIPPSRYESYISLYDEIKKEF